MIRRLIPILAFAAVAATNPVTSFAQDSKVDIDFPLGIGLRIPQYDRVNGLTLPFGPTVTFGDERLVLEPTLAYRTHLGAFDPSLKARYRFDTLFSISLNGGRGTFSNERWIRPDIMNSIWSLLFGRDSRNYFRADRGEAQADLRLATDNLQSEIYLGALWENAWSTGWRVGERKEPLSLIDKGDSLNGMRRPNPLINQGHIASALVGGKLAYKPGSERFNILLDARIESAFKSPLSGQFTQITLSQEGYIQTILGQRLEIESHLVTTSGDPTPAQRFAYLGGSGTLPTIDALMLGGDRLFYVDTRYRIPIPVVELPFLSAPYIAPRFVMGAANVRKFGATTREAGVRLGAGFLWIQYLRNVRTDREEFSGGFSLPR